jgi:hypothetical protein
MLQICFGYALLLRFGTLGLYNDTTVVLTVNVQVRLGLV